MVGGYDCPCVVLCAHAQIIAEVGDASAHETFKVGCAKLEPARAGLIISGVASGQCSALVVRATVISVIADQRRAHHCIQ